MKIFVKKIKLEVPEMTLTLVVGKDINKICKQIDSLIKKKDDRENFKEDVEEIINDECRGAYNSYKSNGIMIFSDWKNNWDHWDTLNHETSHFVDQAAQYFSFEEESEFKAYLHEFVFKKIRTIFSKIK